jgi:hypothetical protein
MMVQGAHSEVETESVYVIYTQRGPYGLPGGHTKFLRGHGRMKEN